MFTTRWNALCAKRQHVSVEPSCPALVCHDDGAFRRSLIKALDETHFTVTFVDDEERALDVLRERGDAFRVVLVSLDLNSKRGAKALEFLHHHHNCGVIILGEPHPDLRNFGTLADETLLKPVDPMYVARRARTYCNC